jgi:L-2,4-diaminobutyrate decarboxylase
MSDDDARDGRLNAAYDPEAFRTLGHQVIDRLADYLREAHKGAVPVLPWREPEELVQSWPADFSEAGAPVDIGRILAASVHQHHPRYLGHQVAVPIPTAALFDLVVAVLNNGMASYEAGPLSSALERNLAQWLGARLGLRERADGFLTSGGTLGNLTALLAARQANAGYDAWTQGTSEAPLCVLASELAHYSVERAVRVMGWGAAGIAPVPVDAHFRMRVDAMEGALYAARAAGRKAIGVVASACASASGMIDPLEPIADFCAQHGLWLHIDGAHGASAALSSRYRGRLAGIERADSVVWDAHKLMTLPGLVTAVLFREGDRSYESFSQEASYLFAPGTRHWHDLGQRNMECTKRAMSVTLYATLASVGTQALDDYVTRQFDLASRFAQMVREAPDFELAVEPDCNIVCFRHTPTPAGTEHLDTLQDRVRERIVREGSFYLSRATLAGRAHLRVTLMNPFTRESDLEALLAEVRHRANSP